MRIPQERDWEEARKSADDQDLRILSLLEEIAAGGGRTSTIVTALEHPRTADPNLSMTRNQISILAAAQLQSGRRLSFAPSMVMMSFRKDERRFWLSRLRHPFLIRRNLGSAMPSIAEAGGYKSGGNRRNALVCTDQEKFYGRPSLDKVKKWTHSRNQSAQVLYNLACYYAYAAGVAPKNGNPGSRRS